MSEVTMTPVQSKACTAIGYDFENGEMHVSYSSGQTSIYSGVPRDIYEAVAGAESVGSAIYSFIRSQGYQHRYL